MMRNGRSCCARIFSIVVMSLAACLISLTDAKAQVKNPWEEYGKLISGRQKVAVLQGGSLFGDSVDPYTGATNFSVTDVSIPGNGPLPVEVLRKFSVSDNNIRAVNDSVFANWDIGIPSVGGVFSPNWHDDRCVTAAPPQLDIGSHHFTSLEYWHGNHADMPGGGSMLRVDGGRAPPTAGGPYLWVTPEDTYFSCLPSILNGSGQGFLAIDKNGTRYWFNHMAKYHEDPVAKGAGASQAALSRKKNVLYATRIEDRFGNWVTYSYSNSSDQPLKVLSISSSDARSISFQYNSNNHVSSVSDGFRTWTYHYQTSTLPSPLGDDYIWLSSVVLPDASSWSYAFSALSALKVSVLQDDYRNCFRLGVPDANGDVSGTVVHPSGAVGTFSFGLQLMGRSNVPALCHNYSESLDVPGLVVQTNDDYMVVPHGWWAWVPRAKKIEGPGQISELYTYSFSSKRTFVYRPGQTKPKCETLDCLEPVCVEDGCAGRSQTTIVKPDGSWERYTFGNSYLYNEGLLLLHEVATSTGSLLKSIENKYELSAGGQSYVARLGISPQSRTDSVMAERVRPLVKVTVVEQGSPFVWEVEKGCSTLQAYCLDSRARPLRVKRTATVSGIPQDGNLVLIPELPPQLALPGGSATGSYALSWSGVSLATYYQIQEQLGTAQWVSIDDSATSFSKSFSSKNTGEWGYRIRACNSAGCSIWSAPVFIQVLLPPASAPHLSAPASSTSGRYIVEWSAVSTATSYELQRRLSGSGWSTVHASEGLQLDILPQASGFYEHRVSACNESGCSPYSAIASTSVSLGLSPPSLSAPTPVMAGTPYNVTWSAVQGAGYYVLEVKRNSANWGIAYEGSALNRSSQSAVSATFYYRVKACSGSMCSAYSPEVEVYVAGAGISGFDSSDWQGGYE